MALEQLLLAQPLISVIIISFLLAIGMTLVYKWTTNQNEMKRLKEELKELQEETKKHKDNQEKMLEIQKDLAGKNLAYMKHSFKPMMYTFLPIILIFGWLHKVFAETGAVMVIPSFGFGIIGINWLWTYIIFSFIFSLTIRKVMKIS